MSKYIPEILKDKISLFVKYCYVVFYGLVAVFFTLALFSFNITDNSFIASTSEPTQNIIGPIGAYVSSFLFYTFGLMAYTFIMFFFVCALKVYLNKKLNLIFLRLLLFFIGLLLLPQFLLELKIEFLILKS